MITRGVMTLRNFVNKKRNRGLIRHVVISIMCAIFVLPAVAGNMAGYHVKAEEQLRYENGETGYQAIIEDDAGLISEEQEKQLLSEMEGITEYGNVAFKTADTNVGSTTYYAENYLHDTFGYGVSATVFLIDMDNRQIYVYSDGALYRVITKSYAQTITDNVYKYATNADYYGCASKAFEQMTLLLQGQKINQPMKYISNTLLGIILAVILNYFLVRAFSKAKSPSGKEVMQGIFVRQNMSNFNSVFERESRTYSPQSSGGGGHGGGGGGHSGGGGGHSF